MKLIRAFDVLPADLRGGAVSIGNFDGVHLGHAQLVERLVAHAHRASGPAIVFTFDPHPVRLLRPAQAPPPLTWTDRKAELLVELGVDVMIAYPTDEALLALEARAFFDDVICRRLGAHALVEGPNFYFGHDRRGTVDLLAQWTSERGMVLEVVPPLVLDGQMVSSSVVRSLIAAGQIDQARTLLTHPYRIRGMVTHGAGRGSKIGFGTANLEAIDTLLPGAGVYAGIGYVNQEPWPAAINIGPNPTFGEHALKVEVHLIGWTEPLYGQPLEVDFLSRLRDVRPFKSVEELKAQLALDVAAAKQIAISD